jgi:dihydrofolate synthase/folylpolyglutamate synthase
MTYQEIVTIIDNKNKFGTLCGRDITSRLLERLGHPEMGLDIIHIAGTNGKGSVAAFVSSILQAASFASSDKFKVGLFTSPHLIKHTERIQVDGVQIPEEAVVRLGSQLLAMDLDFEPTMLDYWMVMAILYFKEQGVKYAVLETGLGGTLDSTNGLAQAPLVCAITSIGLEHTQYLGDTVEKIAGEKAGIIKPSVPVVIGEMPLGAKQVIMDRCKNLGCEFTEATELSADVKLGLFGKYQRKNAAVAFEIAKLLNIPEAAILQGFADASWPGRMQIVSKSPFVMVDGAHNPSGVQALYDSLVYEFPNEQFSFIMAVMADKDYRQMLNILRPIASRIYTVRMDMKRALDVDKMPDTVHFDSYEKALEAAESFREKIIVCGSLYFIAQVIAKD